MLQVRFSAQNTFVHPGSVNRSKREGGEDFQQLERQVYAFAENDRRRVYGSVKQTAHRHAATQRQRPHHDHVYCRHSMWVTYESRHYIVDNLPGLLEVDRVYDCRCSRFQLSYQQEHRPSSYLSSSSPSVLGAQACTVEEGGVVRLRVAHEPLHRGDHVHVRQLLALVQRIIYEQQDVLLAIISVPRALSASTTARVRSSR